MDDSRRSYSPFHTRQRVRVLPTDGSGTGAPTADPDGDGIANLIEYALADTGTSFKSQSCWRTLP
jgi:hypothetical protein